MNSLYYIQLIASFSIVGFCMYLFYKFTKTMKQKKFSGDLKIVDRCVLDNSNQLVVVSIKDRKLLLSTGSKGVSFIQDLTKQPISNEKVHDSVVMV